MWPSAETYHALIRGDRRGPIAALTRAGLRAASWPYGFGVWWRNRLYDRGWKTIHQAAVPVVSVGNLTLGGTGKTPCVEYVAGFYRDLGLPVAILSRGYGADQGRNDEAMVLEENLPDVPHLQGPDRVALATTAVEELEVELLVLDDGFQHRRLGRELDIVLIDATAPPSRDYLFPRGTLREQVRGLGRAGVFLLTRCDQVDPAAIEEARAWLTTRFPGCPVATSEHRPTELIGVDRIGAVDDLRGRVVGAFSGIGNPAAFRRTLEDLGARVAAFRAFPDHHPYARADIDDLNDWASGLPPGAMIATTQKDWVKLRVPDLGGRSLWAVRIGLAIRDGREAFNDALRRVVHDNWT